MIPPHFDVVMWLYRLFRAGKITREDFSDGIRLFRPLPTEAPEVCEVCHARPALARIGERHYCDNCAIAELQRGASRDHKER